jgi:hypothetical protein
MFSEKFTFEYLFPRCSLECLLKIRSISKSWQQRAEEMLKTVQEEYIIMWLERRQKIWAPPLYIPLTSQVTFLKNYCDMVPFRNREMPAWFYILALDRRAEEIPRKYLLVQNWIFLIVNRLYFLGGGFFPDFSHIVEDNKEGVPMMSKMRRLYGEACL